MQAAAAEAAPVRRVTEPVRDPVQLVRYAFERDGDDLIVHCWLEPGGSVPAHWHRAQTERWTVLEGAVCFQLGRRRRVVRPEDGVVVVAPGTTHGLANLERREARVRGVATPALSLQGFLEESVAAAREGLFARGGVPLGARGARWAARFLKRHREETVLASPPPVVQRLLIAAFARDA